MIITDDSLGEIRLVSNKRAKRIIVRRKDNYFQLTHPEYVSISVIRKTIEEMRPQLEKMLRKATVYTLLTPDTVLKTIAFELKLLESSSTSNYYVTLKDGILFISCPGGTDFRDEKVQTRIKNSIVMALRHAALSILPGKIEFLSKAFGFNYSSLKINKSRGRWGSCSSTKNINLSLYCMLLPEYLIDFVILHELCHTIEMNHGERFWLLLDKVSGGRSKQYTRDLKNFKTII